MYLARAQGRNDTLAATEIGPAESDVEGVCPGHLAIMVTRCNHKGGASSIPPKHQVGIATTVVQRALVTDQGEEKRRDFPSSP